MKVTLEAQHAVGREEPRGIGHYAISLIQTLLCRKAFEYTLTYFDYGRKAGNSPRAKRLFGSFGVPLRECSELDYRVATRDAAVYSQKTYGEWTNTDGDILHFMEPVTIPLRYDGRMVLTVHDLNWMSHPDQIAPHSLPLYNEGTRRMEIARPRIIAVSESAKAQLLHYTNLREETVSVVYQSYDEENLFPDRADVSKIVSGDYLLYVGALAPNKNIPRIIGAFSRIAAKHPGLRLVICGKAFFNDRTPIDEALRASPCRDRIVMPGYITAEQKRQLYSGALCFLFPSICEGFGIPVLEAMACGCPVITADNTSLPEAGGDAAVYVDALDTDSLAFETERVVSSDTLRREMTEKGFRQVRRFSWERCATQVEAVYREAER